MVLPLTRPSFMVGLFKDGLVSGKTINKCNIFLEKAQALAAEASASQAAANGNQQQPVEVERLLLNFRRTVYPARAPLRSALYVAQKKKKLIDLYEKLSCEAFSNDQIDSALSSLRLTIAVAGGSVSVISTSRKDRNECPESPTTGEDLSESAESSNIPTTGEGLVPVKGKRDEEETLGSCQSSQPDWIRQYMRRLKEILIK
ncbi:unnamed protein product [Microthlaspi erraticum]|uniref:Uncharacterized protein n=1 Tax=Microthlaspi erraticum TaxID=1685480 RepID=A0A6D2L7Z0_9BRAS|nr:unnamed protein product [Microthlaspi erraticum]